MNIFFSGIGGVGLGPLAEIASSAGHTVTGTDPSESLMTRQLQKAGVHVERAQDGSYLREVHETEPIDWVVHTAAMPNDHPELNVAHELGIKVSKRDELLAEIIAGNDLKLIAVSGTHGKTTTTGMLVWAFKQLGIPVSYSVGTTISFGKSGEFDPASDYFIYECDEFDRNFLHFSPHLSLITTLGHDHTDTYPTEKDYFDAFKQFIDQSEHSIGWQRDLSPLDELPSERIWQLRDDETAVIAVPGEHNRRNATLVLKAFEYLGLGDAREALESFPGTNRRFEKLSKNLYTDYGHHPTEIAATLQMAREMSDHVVLVYQPHQNRRQHELMASDAYRESFVEAESVYWLPTYLSRENPELPILTYDELAASVVNKQVVRPAEMHDALWTTIELHRANDHLVLCMGAGSIDGWVRSRSFDRKNNGLL